MKEKYVTITTPARQHLLALLAQHPNRDLAIRIFVEDAGTPNAHCCMAFCEKANPHPGDKAFVYGELLVYLDKDSTPFLKSSTLDYSVNEEIPGLQFHAPNAMPENPREDAMMETFLEQYRRGLVKR